MTKMLNDNSIDYFPPDVATKPASWDSSEDRPAVKYPDGDNEDDGAILSCAGLLTICAVPIFVLFIILKVMGVL